MLLPCSCCNYLWALGRPSPLPPRAARPGRSARSQGHSWQQALLFSAPSWKSKKQNYCKRIYKEIQTQNTNVRTKFPATASMCGEEATKHKHNTQKLKNQLLLNLKSHCIQKSKCAVRILHFSFFSNSSFYSLTLLHPAFKWPWVSYSRLALEALVGHQKYTYPSIYLLISLFFSMRIWESITLIPNVHHTKKQIKPNLWVACCISSSACCSEFI